MRRSSRRAAGFATFGLAIVALAAAASAQPATPAAAPMAAATPYGAVVPVGVRIDCVIAAPLDSATAHVGDPFQFKTAKAVKLGNLEVPAGTPGHGRIAMVTVATAKGHGNLGLEADSIDLPDGTPIWVNVDPRVAITGHLSNHRTVVQFLNVTTDYYGNMQLFPGDAFVVVTTERRAVPAPLITAPPTPIPPPAAQTVPPGTSMASPMPSPMGTVPAMGTPPPPPVETSPGPAVPSPAPTST